MTTTPYPKGTTKEQWDAFEIKMIAHEEFIKDYKFYLERIVNHIRFYYPDKLWTPGEIQEVMSKEISKSHSMDAPNEPGYYRANND